MSYRHKRWKLAPSAPESILRDVVGDLPLSLPLAQVLFNREITNAEDTRAFVDGEDIIPMLKGKSWKRSKPMYWYFYRAKPQLALRVGDWVLVGYQKYAKMPTSHPMIREDIEFIKNAQWDRFELYHLATDRKQQKDLADKERDKLETMKKTLYALHNDIIAEVPHWSWV